MTATILGLLPALHASAAEQATEGTAQLINEVRQRTAGCGELLKSAGQQVRGVESLASRPALVWNPQLAAAAEQHSRAMAELAFFDHRGRDGRRVSDRADAAGYRWRSIGENLAAGYRSLEEALRGWVRSEGHCRNLLDERFSDFGLARVVSDRPNDRYRVYWTLVLGRPAGTTSTTSTVTRANPAD